MEKNFTNSIRLEYQSLHNRVLAKKHIHLLHWTITLIINYILYHKIPYYNGVSFEVMSMYIIQIYSLIAYYELISFPCLFYVLYL